MAVFMSSFSKELKSLPKFIVKQISIRIDDRRIKFYVSDSISRVINFGQFMLETKLSGDDYTFVFLRHYH